MKKNKNIIQIIKQAFNNKYIIIALSIFFAVAYFLTALYEPIKKETYSTKYYNEYSREHNLKEYVGVEQDKLDELYHKLVLYIFSGEESLMSEFNERETEHMRDVKSLYDFGNSITSTLFIYIPLFYFFIAKKDINKYKRVKYFRNTLLIVTISVAILAIFIYLDFDSAFIKFHEIFFDNDLWILNPKTDIMIRMLPQDYFMNMAFRIFGSFASIITSTIFASSLYLWFNRNLNIKEKSINFKIEE